MRRDYHLRVVPSVLLKKPSIAIVGHGNFGRVLAATLKRRGYRVDEIVRRTSKPRLSADVIWFCVPDKAIASSAKALANKTDWKGKIAVHSSGALAAAELRVLQRRGAKIASAHPLNTFVKKSKPELAGVPFAIEGDARASRMVTSIARKLNADAPVIRIRPQEKPLYHAMGAFASPLLIALLANAEVVGKTAGIKDPHLSLAKIVRTTLNNYLAHGAEGAFSGPIVRGDVATVRKHLAALKNLPRQRSVYRALAESALALLPTPLKRL
jgi:predicted short-subunit dehydrogenase-like oxidoreductase (DUF2520 family)